MTISWFWSWEHPAGYGLGVFVTWYAFHIDLIVGTLSVEF